MDLNRRDFTRKIVLAGGGVAAFPVIASNRTLNSQSAPADSSRLKISLNAYSFNGPLRAGTMTLDDLLEFCAGTGFHGVDITGYYFPGYPAVPPDEIIYHVRRKAFMLGLELGCTGVRNDFGLADPAKRTAEKQLVKEWSVVAHKLGAPGLRIFSGSLPKDDFSWDQRAEWIAQDIRECADFASGYGVMLTLQNHNDFLKTSADVEKLMTMIDHDWVGLMLDIGSYHTPDPYEDIAANVKLAVTWQVKEKVFIGETQTDTDFRRLLDIINQSGYRGCLPLETLGAGDPYSKVTSLFNKIRSVVSS